jgi:hypothetical protein
MSRPELFEEPRPGRLQYWGRRLRESGSVRLRRALGALRTDDARDIGAPRPGSGPRFEISGFDTKFEEIETVLHDPQIVDCVERQPPAPFERLSPPAPRLPTGASLRDWPARPRRAPVYDIVPMSIELDMLELRLGQLYDLVDRFIVVESPRCYGGPRKPLFLSRNLQRFAPFAAKLTHVVVPEEAVLSVYPERRRRPTYAGDDAVHRAMWTAIRERIVFEPDAVIVSSDLDEIPSRDLVHCLRELAVPLPMRIRTPALRYRFSLRDPDTETDIVVFSPGQFDQVDADGRMLRFMPAKVWRAAGTVHLTSFLPPLALVAKFAMTTDWDPGILPFIRNEHDEAAAMLLEGRWFSRRLPAYDPDADPEHLVPWIARMNRARYAHYWTPAAG